VSRAAEDDCAKIFSQAVAFWQHYCPIIPLGLPIASFKVANADARNWRYCEYRRVA